MSNIPLRPENVSSLPKKSATRFTFKYKGQHVVTHVHAGSGKACKKPSTSYDSLTYVDSLKGRQSSKRVAAPAVKRKREEFEGLPGPSAEPSAIVNAVKAVWEEHQSPLSPRHPSLILPPDVREFLLLKPSIEQPPVEQPSTHPPIVDKPPIKRIRLKIRSKPYSSLQTSRKENADSSSPSVAAVDKQIQASPRDVAHDPLQGPAPSKMCSPSSETVKPSAEPSAVEKAGPEPMDVDAIGNEGAAGNMEKPANPSEPSSTDTIQQLYIPDANPVEMKPATSNLSSEVTSSSPDKQAEALSTGMPPPPEVSKPTQSLSCSPAEKAEPAATSKTQQIEVDARIAGCSNSTVPPVDGSPRQKPAAKAEPQEDLESDLKLHPTYLNREVQTGSGFLVPPNVLGSYTLGSTAQSFKNSVSPFDLHVKAIENGTKEARSKSQVLQALRTDIAKLCAQLDQHPDKTSDEYQGRLVRKQKMEVKVAELKESVKKLASDMEKEAASLKRVADQQMTTHKGWSVPSLSCYARAAVLYMEVVDYLAACDSNSALGLARTIPNLLSFIVGTVSSAKSNSELAKEALGILCEKLCSACNLRCFRWDADNLRHKCRTVNSKLQNLNVHMPKNAAIGLDARALDKSKLARTQPALKRVDHPSPDDSMNSCQEHAAAHVHNVSIPDSLLHDSKALLEPLKALTQTLEYFKVSTNSLQAFVEKADVKQSDFAKKVALHIYALGSDAGMYDTQLLVAHARQALDVIQFM